MKPGEGICFVFDDSIAIDLDRMNDSYLGLDNYNDWDDVVDALIAYGVPDNIIEQYVNKSNLEYVKALLRSFDVAIRYDRIEKNATGFLIKGLKTAYNIPKKYYTSSMESLNT
jgi:molybdate-binding protein